MDINTSYKVNMLFLGTGAAELFPNPFCSCKTCQMAFASDDTHNHRRRSAILLDEENLIDCGPDMLNACIEFNAPLMRLKNIFITHLHDDHIDFRALNNLYMCSGPAPHLNMFMSPEAYAGLRRLKSDIDTLDYTSAKRITDQILKDCDFIPLKPFMEYLIDDMTVSAVYGRHGGQFTEEKSLNYLFKKNGETTFLAFDTGLFHEETFEYLSGKRVDLMVIDGTFGSAPVGESCRHLNLQNLQRTVDRLVMQGTLYEKSRIVVTHIGHKGLLLHDEYDSIIKKMFGNRASVAYDGMRL